MAVRSGSNRFSFDALLSFRLAGVPGMTATAASGFLPLDNVTGYWTAGDLNISAEPFEFAVEVQVESISGAGASVAYTVEVATDNLFTAPVTVADTTVSAAGLSTLMVSREAINAAGPMAFIRVKATISGTTPVVAWNAYAAPVVV